MAISPLLRPLGIAAAILGACQGLVWTVLTLLSILIATEEWIPEFSTTQIFETAVYTVFFNPQELASLLGEESLIMTEDVFLGFSCFYMVLSFIWMVISLTMLWVLLREKWVYGSKTVKAWSCITGITALFDFIVMIMLAVDYSTIDGKITEEDVFSIVGGFPLLVAIGSVMAIVTRGYVLWVAHVIFAIYFFRWASEITDHDTGKDGNRRPYIDGYSDPWQTSEPPRFPRANDNQGFQHDERNFPRSFSQQDQLQQQQQQQPRRFVPPNEAQTLPQKPPKPRAPQQPQQQYQPQQQQYQPPQQQQQGPYIPHPDYPNYSPNDLERMPRSALKTRSYYN